MSTAPFQAPTRGRRTTAGNTESQQHEPQHTPRPPLATGLGVWRLRRKSDSTDSTGRHPGDGQLGAGGRGSGNRPSVGGTAVWID
jgi:hypothetical protein